MYGIIYEATLVRIDINTDVYIRNNTEYRILLVNAVPRNSLNIEIVATITYIGTISII